MNKMKKYIAYFAVLALTVAGFTSCLDEEPPFKDNGNYGIVELDLSARTTTTPFAIRNVSRGTAEVVEVPVVVNYTGVNGTPEDVQVTLGIDNAAVTAYATATSTTVVVLPEGSYQLPASSTVTIPKGEKKATYTIRVTAAALDPNVAVYGIGVKIVSATGGTISGNYSTGVYRLTR
jgi:hypothetical protein